MKHIWPRRICSSKRFGEWRWPTHRGLESYEVVAEEVQYTSSCEPSDFIANCDPARKGDILAGNLILGSNEVEWVQATWLSRLL